jgi:nitrile hydratase accessory protein
MNELADAIALMGEQTSPPRDNGELVFDAPWQARAFAIALVAVERSGLTWDAFRLRLMDAIGDEPNRPYYDSWVAALEALVVSAGLTTPAELDSVDGRPERGRHG